MIWLKTNKWGGKGKSDEQKQMEKSSHHPLMAGGSEFDKEESLILPEICQLRKEHKQEQLRRY